MTTRIARLGAVAVAALALTAPAAAAKNDVNPTTWGGFEFSDSDRDSQAAADTLALAVDPGGQAVATIGTANGRFYAYRYDTSGRQTARFRVPASTAVAIAGDGTLYAGSSSGLVRRYGATGASQGSFPAGGAVAALAVDGAGDVYVASGSAVRRFSPTGAQTGSFEGQVGTAAAVAVDGGGNVFVADPPHGRVAVFDASGTPTRTIGGPDAAGGSLSKQLTGVGVDTAGNVFVADPGGGGFDLKLFAPDGHFEQVVDRGFFAAASRPFAPLLLAVAPQGDLYFTPYNPDVQKIPAAVLPAPRFRIEDATRYGSDNDLRPVAVSVGRTYQLTVRVYPSLSSGERATLALPAGMELAPGTEASVPVAVPAGQEFASVVWPVKVTAPGRHAAAVTVDGTGPDGTATTLTKLFPIYGASGPTARVLGAVFLPRARTMFVAAQIGIGGFKVAPADAYDLADYISISQIDMAARSGGRGLPRQQYSIGGPLDGECQPFTVPRGTSGLRPTRVTARFAPLGGLGAARVTRTIRPVLHTKNPVLKGCLEASGLAGGPTG